MSRTNYIFVDFQNVHETEWERIIGRPVHVTVVLGEQHKYFPIPVVKILLKCASQISLVETKKAGKNAADFVLAKLIGERNESDPHGYIHIVSKDKGFDALIDHLHDSKILAARRESLSDIPVLMNAEERVSLYERFLKANTVTHPRQLKAMQSQIQALFGKALSQEELDQLVAELKKRRIISTDDKGKVSYPT